MSSFDKDFPQAFIQPHEPPCISLYQPTHRAHPENAQDRIRFKNLIDKVELTLEEHYSKKESEQILKHLHQLEADHEFWTHNQQGLAILANKNFFKIFKLARPVDERLLIADNFYIKPLIRIIQSADRYQILGVTRDKVKLFEGNRDFVYEVKLNPNIPQNMEDALGEETPEARLTVSSYGSRGGEGKAMYHGHGGTKDSIDIDTERFFRIIDSGVYHYHSQHSHLPLILMALPEHHAMFHKVSKNPFLLSNDLPHDPESLNLEQLKEKAWEVWQPIYLQRLEKLNDSYNQSVGKQLASDKIEEIAKAAVEGRIDSLMIDSGQSIPGKVNPETGEISRAEGGNGISDDILDELGHLVMQHKGQVVVIDREKMPTDSGAAAIFRY